MCVCVCGSVCVSFIEMVFASDIEVDLSIFNFKMHLLYVAAIFEWFNSVCECHTPIICTLQQLTRCGGCRNMRCDDVMINICCFEFVVVVVASAILDCFSIQLYIST